VDATNISSSYFPTLLNLKRFSEKMLQIFIFFYLLLFREPFSVVLQIFFFFLFFLLLFSFRAFSVDATNHAFKCLLERPLASHEGLFSMEIITDKHF
jgi:hypothetical protein